MGHDTFAWNRKPATILLSVSSFVLTLCVFGPATIYLGNFMEFSSHFFESVLFSLQVSLGLIVILFTAVFLLSRQYEVCRIIVSLLLVSAFLMWFQGSIIVWQYGVLDGKDIEWSTLIHYGIIDSLFWAALIAFSIIQSDMIFRISRFLSIILILVQLLSVSQLWISMPKNQGFRQQEINTAESETNSLFLFSGRANVIILVLDTFQSDIFQDIILESPELETAFDGFTYFRNSLAGSDATCVSIPNMLTARNYDNSVPYLEFVRGSFLENSLPKTLKEYGFRIDLYPIYAYTVYNDFSGVPLASKKLADRDAYLKEQAFIADLALFRCLPHFVKEFVYNHQRWFLSGFVERYQNAEKASRAVKDREPNPSGVSELTYAREFENSKTLIGKNWDAGFIHRMVPRSGILKSGNAFKFYHLNGIHLQLVMNEDLAYEQLKPTRASMKRQGTGIVKIAAIFLERLKQLEAYDDSLIFIVGDHGSGFADAGINMSPYSANFNTRGPYKGNFKSFKAAGIPLILAKRIKSTGRLRTSDAPVSLSDIPQTVVEELGLDARFPGESMFLVKENENRERIYRAFVGPQENVEYLAPLYEYSVNGFSWDDTSWRETGNVYYADPK